MDKEEELLRKRFLELSNQAFQRGIVMYTDFLNLNELNILHTTPKNLLAVPFRTFGGYAFAERQMAAFLPDAFYLYTDEDEILGKYPMSVIQISPLNGKFAEDLGHSDYLGALLNLGIERSKLGDILIQEKMAYLFACDGMVDFICNELTRVRHTTVQAVRIEREEFDYEPRYEEIRGTVASVRLDSLLSLAWNSSRSKMAPLIEEARVYVNGKLITSNGYHVRENDIISVRGMGRFRYMGMISETKKGRCYVLVYKYI